MITPEDLQKKGFASIEDYYSMLVGLNILDHVEDLQASFLLLGEQQRIEFLTRITALLGDATEKPIKKSFSKLLIHCQRVVYKKENPEQKKP